MSDYTNAKRLQHDSQRFEREVMSWQKNMSDTSHQREVADLKKAGLNPVLSASGSGGGGATAYTTSATDSGTGAAATWLSARQSAKATRYAAAQAAAATRYSAGVQANAMIAASANNRAAAQYQADMQYKSAKYTADQANIRNPLSYVATGVGMIGKAMRNFRNIGTSKYDVSIGRKNYFVGAVNNLDTAYSRVSFRAKMGINTTLRINGYKSTRANQNLLAYYMYTGNMRYLRRLKK